MKKVVIAIDSFKGSVSSAEAANACAKGILRIYPDCKTVCLPVADGGEGTVSALVGATEGEYISCRVHDPLMRPIDACYGISGDGKTVVIELAAASGLHLLSPNEYDPVKTTTYGTGELIADALRRGYRNFLIGLGGSATNDAGTGILQALGIRFTDTYGNLIEPGKTTLSSICGIDTSGLLPTARESKFTLLCDVTNPFVGDQGAVAIFSPQKGANLQMQKILEKGMIRFSQLIRRGTGEDIGDIPGSGAAGGTAGGLLAFLHAQIKSGIATILDILKFDEQLSDTDLVITGEGKLDVQTLNGKVPFGILQRATKASVPVVALAGSVENVNKLNEAGFLAAFSIQTAPISLQLAMDKTITLHHIEQTTSQCIRLFRTKDS